MKITGLPGEEKEEKRGWIEDRMREECVYRQNDAALCLPLHCLLFTADTLHRRRSRQEVKIWFLHMFVCVCVAHLS